MSNAKDLVICWDAHLVSFWSKIKSNSMLLLICLLAVPSAHPFRKINLFPCTLMKARGEGKYAKFHILFTLALYGTGHIHATSNFHLHPLSTSWVDPTLSGYTGKRQLLPLPRTKIPCYPAHTKGSKTDYTMGGQTAARGNMLTELHFALQFI